jgi:D-arginine dehydrogenase
MIWDFIVIGGGIAGTSAGARLSDTGHRSPAGGESALAYHASGRSAALYEANYGHPVTIALNKASRADHDTLDGGLPVAARPHAARRAGRGATAEADIDTMALVRRSRRRRRGRMSRSSIRQHVTRAGYHEAAWDIDTDRMVQHFARTIRSNGGEVHAGNRVTAIARDGARWSVTASDGRPTRGASS